MVAPYYVETKREFTKYIRKLCVRVCVYVIYRGKSKTILCTESSHEILLAGISAELCGGRQSRMQICMRTC